jgi:hypothetical protein
MFEVLTDENDTENGSVPRYQLIITKFNFRYLTQIRYTHKSESHDSRSIA